AIVSVTKVRQETATPLIVKRLRLPYLAECSIEVLIIGSVRLVFGFLSRPPAHATAILDRKACGVPAPPRDRVDAFPVESRGIWQQIPSREHARCRDSRDREARLRVAAIGVSRAPRARCHASLGQRPRLAWQPPKG